MRISRFFFGKMFDLKNICSKFHRKSRTQQAKYVRKKSSYLKKNVKRVIMHKMPDGVVVIAISLFPKFPGSIPERGTKRRLL